MNKRDSESLVDKHNESLLVMPVLFSNNGYDVTVCDPPYANYKWVPDLSIYDDYPEIDAYITDGSFSAVEQQQYIVSANMRNFFCFSLIMPPIIFAITTIATSITAIPKITDQTA